MSRILSLFIISFWAMGLFAQDTTFPYQFSNEKSAEATSVKDQNRTGTCWSFATTSFLESELMRMGKGQHDLSEMFAVRVTYPRKAEMYLRYMGKAQFGPGSLSHDVINAMRDHGVVPESVYDGLEYGADQHNHAELDAILRAMVEKLSEQNKLTHRWDEALAGVLDAYLGEYPSEFEYEGETYSPATFRDYLGLNASDYVSLSSFTHHPFYEEFILEVPDNFSQGKFHNLPLDELMSVINNALENGYTIAWDADVSEPGFSFGNGIAVLPKEPMGRIKTFDKIIDEPAVSQEMRQEAFDSHATTDDHLMHITGTAEDQNGTTYYLTKNSWGQGNELKGYQYVSEAYLKMKTVGIVVHKDALPRAIAKKLGM